MALAVTYATKEDFVKAYGFEEAVALTNLHDRTAADIDEVVLERARVAAFALINALILSAFSSQMPFAQPPPLLVFHELRITRRYLDSIMPRPDVHQDYVDSIVSLKSIAKGEVALGYQVGSTTVVQQGTAGKGSVGIPGGIFNDSGLSGWLQ